MIDASIDVGLRIFFALVLFIIAKIIISIILWMVGRALKGRKIDPSVIGFCRSVLKFFLWFIAISTICGVLGLDTVTLGAVGAAIAFALGASLGGMAENLIGGILILMNKPFVVGEFIDGAGVSGVVKEIGIFATFLTTGDNKIVLINNSSLVTAVITNVSRQPLRRVDMTFGIGYDDDIRLAKQVLHRLLEAHPHVLAEPAWTVEVSELADSSVNLVCRPFVKKANYWSVLFDFHEMVYTSFNKVGLSIPFNQQVHHVFKEPAPAGPKRYGRDDEALLARLRSFPKERAEQVEPESPQQIAKDLASSVRNRMKKLKVRGGKGVLDAEEVDIEDV